MINSSLEWQAYRKDVIGEKINQTGGHPDLIKILHRVDHLVAELSKAEVIARQRKISFDRLPELSAVNDAIKSLEHFILEYAMVKLFS